MRLNAMSFGNSNKLRMECGCGRKSDYHSVGQSCGRTTLTLEKQADRNLLMFKKADGSFCIWFEVTTCNNVG